MLYRTITVERVGSMYAATLIALLLMFSLGMQYYDACQVEVGPVWHVIKTCTCVCVCNFRPPSFSTYPLMDVHACAFVPLRVVV